MNIELYDLTNLLDSKDFKKELDSLKMTTGVSEKNHPTTLKDSGRYPD